MDERAEQGTAIKRLGKQITELFKWIKNQWQTNPLVFVIVVALVGAIAWAGYLRIFEGRGWADWTEFGEYTGPDKEYHRAKTLWDLLELLIIPIVLAMGAWWLNKSERGNELRIAKDNREEDKKIADERRHQATLEAYFDRMVELLVEHHLLAEKSATEEKVMLCTIARTRTLAVLRSLDGKRKGHVVQFLYESGLIGPEPVIVSLNGADLSEADLSEINLIDAHLGGVNLRKANLGGALLCKSWLVETDLDQASLRKTDLRGCNLSGANLAGADLRGAGLEGDSEDEEANLLGVNLDGANLKGAFVSDEQLRCARSLRGTTLPDGTKAPDETTEPTSAQVSEPTPPTIIDKFVYQDTR
jgi:hypothetical protein